MLSYLTLANSLGSVSLKSFCLQIVFWWQIHNDQDNKAITLQKSSKAKQSITGLPWHASWIIGIRDRAVNVDTAVVVTDQASYFRPRHGFDLSIFLFIFTPCLRYPRGIEWPFIWSVMVMKLYSYTYRHSHKWCARTHTRTHAHPAKFVIIIMATEILYKWCLKLCRIILTFIV